MGQAKRDRESADKAAKAKQLRTALIADKITAAQTEQLVAAGAIVEMDPADAERLKVIL